MNDLIKKVFKNDNRIMIGIYVVFSLVAVYYGVQLVVPLVLDEVGTIANTAFLYGDNWSVCAQSMGGFYYKYGTSLLYYPIYCLFRDNPVMLYRLLIGLHMALMAFVPVIAYKICRSHLHIESIPKALLLAISSGGISSLWLYSTYARADAVLIFLPWILALLLLEASSANMLGNKKKLNICTILLALVMVYSYASHSRGLVLIIATCMTVVVVSFFYRKHLVNYFIFVPLTGVLLVIDKFVAAYFKTNVYGPEGTRHASIESFDFDTFKQLMTPEGLIIELKLCVGWLFNLFASSMGLVIIGAIAAFIIILIGIRKKTASTQEFTLSVFSLLCLLGTFAMGALFFFPPAWKLFMGTDLDITRADRIVYGRYTVGAVGPICLVALYTLTSNKKFIGIKSKILSVLAYIGVLFLFTTKVGPAITNIPSTNSRYFLSLVGFLEIKEGKTNAAFPDLNDALTKVGIVALVLMIVILVLTMFKKNKVNLAVLAMVFVLSAVNFNYVFVNVRNERDNIVIQRVEYISSYIYGIDNIEEIADEYPFLYKDPTATQIKYYQMVLPMFNLGKLKYIKSHGDIDNFIIICGKKKIDQAIAECEKPEFFGNGTPANYYTFDSFDYKRKTKGTNVILVRGDDLAKALMDNGCKLTKYNYQ